MNLLHELHELLLEKGWNIEATGEWEGMNMSDIQKVADSLRAKKTRTKEESRRLRAANFAIRAKRAGGKKWTGVKAK